MSHDQNDLVAKSVHAAYARLGLQSPRTTAGTAEPFTLADAVRSGTIVSMEAWARQHGFFAANEPNGYQAQRGDVAIIRCDDSEHLEIVEEVRGQLLVTLGQNVSGQTEYPDYQNHGSIVGFIRLNPATNAPSRPNNTAS